MTDPVDVTLRFKKPDKQAKGFLRRTQKAVEFAELFEEKKVNKAMLDAMVDFLMEFVTEPTDRRLAHDALMDASEEQILELLREIGGAKQAEPNPPSGGG